MPRPFLRVAVAAVAALAGCAAPPPSEPRARLQPAFNVPGGRGAQEVAGAPGPRRNEPARAPEDDDLRIYLVPVGSSPVRGKPTALVTLVEFGDFQCPYCSRAEDTIRGLELKYGDKIRVVWKNEPLPFHELAEPAAELALEARARKGEAGFWKVHDLLIAERGRIDGSVLEEVARAAGLDVATAARNVAAHKYQAAIDEDLDLSDDVQANGTPHFFINGRRLSGAQPIERFVELIDEQIEVAQAALRRGVAPAALYETLQKGAVTATLEALPVPLPPPGAESPSRGPADAKVVVQIWSDFECPYCLRVEPTLAALEAAFPGKIRLVWRNHPLPFHPHAAMAAEAAMEAYAQQGAAGFWKMHDLLIQHQAGLERPAIEQYAASIGLDPAKFRAALDTSAHRASIAADTRLAESEGLTGTPGFAINGYRMGGAQPLGRFKKVVQRALAEAK